jgi:hypothetical protein
VRRLLSRDLFSGVSEIAHIDESSGRVVVESVQDVQAVIDRNKSLASESDGYTADRTMRHEASIPPNIYVLWLTEGMPHGGREQLEFIDKKLADPNWAHLSVHKKSTRVGWIK